jgi:3-oxoacyl-[acyl-carrier protein] reductase
LNDLTPVNLDVTLAEATRLGAQAQEYLFDVARRMPVAGMIEQVLSDWGRIDILINNAAVHPRQPLLDMDDWDWQRTIDVNLSGPFFAMQIAGRAMRQQGGGVIVNIGAAFENYAEWAGSAGFVASKSGLLGLTRQAASELAPYNIRVYALCLTSAQVEQPERAVEQALRLCSQASAQLSGQAITLDGSDVSSKQ